MFPGSRILLLSSIVLFAGCHTAKKVAVTSFRVIDTPARFVRDRIDPDPSTTTTTTTTTTSDVVNPGYPVAPATPPPARVTTTQGAQGRATTTTARSTTGSTGAPARSTTGTTATNPSRPPVTSENRPPATTTPRPQASTSQGFPTARPVPGKPGFVYSLDPNGGIVDVTGYKSGDKAKDPYTQQIFVIP